MNIQATFQKNRPLWQQGKLSFFLALIIAGLAEPAMSLPDDKDQPISIQSDKAEQTSNKDGEVTTYSGAVIMAQGFMLLEGDTVTIYSQNRSVNKVIAVGQPARFQQQSNTNESPIKARGNRIVYNVNKEIIVLHDAASIEQDDSLMKGQRIEYRVASEMIKAKGTDDKSTRVHVVLEPGKQPLNNNKEKDGNANSE